MTTKQTKIDRSAAMLLPGAMALAATAASSQAAVQITLLNNKISTGGNFLVADLTADGTDDITLTDAYWAPSAGSVRAVINGSFVRARTYSTGYLLFFADARFRIGGRGVVSAIGGTPQVASYLNPITFTDSRINGGVETGAWLEVHAFNTSATEHTVELTRLIFDDASTGRPAFTEIPGAQTEWSAVSAVPEASTSLGLLALGAGGLLTRRRLKRAA